MQSGFKTQHFGFFHNSCTSWEEITVYAETEERAWELMERKGYDADEYVCENLGSAKNEIGQHIKEQVIIND